MKIKIYFCTIIILFLVLSIIVYNKEKMYEIPKIYFKGNITDMNSKKDVRNIELTYVSKDLEFSSYAKIKIQGTSSLAYEKKNYTINLFNSDSFNEKYEIEAKKGWGKQSSYCLKANWIDKTHSRNIVTAKIAASIQKKYNLFMDTPNNGLIDGFPVEVYVNNEFLGIYTMNIPKSAWMFNMDETNPNHIVLSADNSLDSTQFYTLASFEDWEVEVGPESEETLNKFNRLTTFIIYSSDNEFKKNFEKYLDLDATINYYILMNIALLEDNYAKNMLMVTYDGEIWYPSLYDLDTSWGTNCSGNNITDYTNIEKYYLPSLLWSKFEKNFKEVIANRYFELRKSILTKEQIIGEFTSFSKLIPKDTLIKEQNRWQNIPGYDIKQIEEFLDIRLPLIDDKMNNFKNSILE